MLTNRINELYRELNTVNPEINPGQIEVDLMDAINNSEITAFFQGKWSVADKKIIGAEALIRWIKDDKIIPPGIFIDFIEESPIIIQLSNIVLKKSIEFCKKKVNSGNTNFIISINICPYQLIHQELTEDIKRELHAADLPAKNLEIEITERSFYNQNPKIITELFKILKFGVNISLDDFGVGYSAISCLVGMPLDIVKIDRSLINNVCTELKSQKLLEGIIDVVHNLGLDVIAEGVETIEQKEWLESVNCEYLQSYYFSKPVNQDEFQAYLSKGGIHEKI